ncbi:hypothetical protein LSAT2_016521 [Lamellibrachia satsuma]|nr:hypothetical protein LSAT2_016521 [Lamellibrachia satsuma]
MVSGTESAITRANFVNLAINTLAVTFVACDITAIHDMQQEVVDQRGPTSCGEKRRFSGLAAVSVSIASSQTSHQYETRLFEGTHIREMALLFQAALLLLLGVAVVRSAACKLFTLGECSADCGIGYATADITCSENGTEFICGRVNMTCNSAPCDGGPGPWSECSASCGGGTKNRSAAGDPQTLPCNTQSCAPADCADPAADVVFVVDSSSSMTNFGFEAAKQLVSDAVSGLPSGVRVSMITFSTTANVAFDLTDAPSAAAILAPKFTGGTGVLAYAVQAAGAALRYTTVSHGNTARREIIPEITPEIIPEITPEIIPVHSMIVNCLYELTFVVTSSSSAAGVPKIAVFLSDGEQMVLEACTNDIATTMRDGGVTMMSVVIGSASPSALYPVTSPELNQNQFLSTDVSAARKISAAIRGALGNCTAGNDSEPALVDTNLLKGEPMMNAGVANTMCGPWSDWTPCSIPCGAQGTREMTMTCTDEKGETITHFKIERCEIICPKPIPNVGEAFCSLRDWNKGMVWIAHPGNCHLYFVCERVYRNKFRMHGIDCGELFWNQYTLLCERKSPNPNVVPCIDVKNHPQRPPKISPICSDVDLILQYDFENGFVDRCQNAPLVQQGSTPVMLQKENGNTIACFDGNAFMRIPYLRNWFSHKAVTEFTVAVWYKRCSIDTRLEQGLIHNGGCLATNTGFQVTTGYGGVFAGVTTNDPFPPGLKQLFAVTAPNSHWLDKAGWQQAVMVFDGENVKLYLQGYERERAPSEGMLHYYNSHY